MTQKATPIRGINPDPTAQIDRETLIKARNEAFLANWRREHTRDVSRAAYACAEAWARGSAT